jgi:uncharacterized protein
MSALIGVVSDTHGFFDPQLRSVFKAVDCIVHAGDVGKSEVLNDLREIAPVLAVRGNVDVEFPLTQLPAQLLVAIAGVEVMVVHRLQDAVPHDTTRVVIAGHSHQSLIQETDRILILNPGAAGRQGFHRERTAMLLKLGDRFDAELVRLGPRSAAAASSCRDTTTADGRRTA